MDHAFERAVKEANEAQRKYLEEKATRDAEARPGMVSSAIILLDILFVGIITHQTFILTYNL